MAGFRKEAANSQCLAMSEARRNIQERATHENSDVRMWWPMWRRAKILGQSGRLDGRVTTLPGTSTFANPAGTMVTGSTIVRVVFVNAVGAPWKRGGK